MKQIVSLSLFFLLIISTLTGCWDRKEINDLAFVIATGVDKGKDDEYKISIQAPLPSAMGGAGSSGGGGGTADKSYYVDFGTGKNIRDSNQDLQSRMSRKLYFAHRRVVIIGEEVAKEGLSDLLNTILIQPQSRLSTYIIMAKGEAIDMLNADILLEQLPGEAYREMAKNNIEVTSLEVLEDIKRPGKEAVIPVLEQVKPDEKSETGQAVKMTTYALLKGDRVRVLTNEKESAGLLWLRDKIRGKPISFPFSEKGEITVRIIQGSVVKNFKVKNGKPAFTLSVEATATLLENEPHSILEDPKIYNKTIKNLEREIKGQITELLNHSHSEGVDVAGFGWYLYRNHNPTWDKKWKDEWQETLKDLEFKVDVNAEIQRMTNTGLDIKE